MIGTTHPVTPEEVMALLDGELPPARAEALAAHLNSCHECRRLGEGIAGISKSMARWSISSPPSSLDRRIEAQLAAATQQGKASLPPRRARWTWKQRTLALGSAGFALLLFAAISIPNLFQSRMAANEATAESRRRAAQIEELERESSDREFAVAPTPPPPPTQRGRLAGGTLGGLRSKQSTSVWGTQGPMIARTVSLSIVVKDFDSARAVLDAILVRHHGYAAEMTANTEKEQARSLSASLRIPAPELQAAVGELKALGRVGTETQKGEEVTTQHADLVARLKNARETEQRLIDVLRTRTGKVSDVLEVEQEIARVRGEIEQMEAERKALEHRVDFATVDLKLKEEYKAQLDIAPRSVATRLRNSLVTGYHDAVESLIGLLLFLAEYGPALLLWALILFWPVRFIWRRMRRAMAHA